MREDRARALRWAAMTRRRHRAAGAVLRAAAPLLPAVGRPERPIFILGSPRSGTTMLFQLLDRSRSLASLGYGSQFIWEMFRPHRIESGCSHAAGPGDITKRERKVVNWAIERVAGDMPYLDKFPRMVLRAEYLAALYPDARFVSIVRDGRAVVSSLVTGWNTPGKFGQGTVLPVPLRVEGYRGRVWRFVLPPGWEAYASGHTLAEVCAFQWAASNTELLDARDRLGHERFFQVRYEDLVRSPVDTTAAMLAHLDLEGDPEVLAHASALDRNVTQTAVTAPRPEKWRDENPDAVHSILAQIAPVMGRLGYPVD
jgi:Sulfotransferase family